MAFISFITAIKQHTSSDMSLTICERNKIIKIGMLVYHNEEK